MRIRGTAFRSLSILLTLGRLGAQLSESAGERMRVAVCNADHIPGWLIEHAKNYAGAVFERADVKVEWTNCDAELRSHNPQEHPDFIVRVRSGGHRGKAGPASLEALGHTFLDADGSGYLADVYYGAIRGTALLFRTAGQDQVLGYTMTHELVHLLVGPGHRRTGVMRAAWRKEDFDAISRSRLNFSLAEQAIILHALRSHHKRAS